MHKHQYTAPDLFVQYRDKDRRSPAQRGLTEQTGRIPVNLATVRGLGARPTQRSLNQFLASAGVSARRARAIRAGYGYA